MTTNVVYALLKAHFWLASIVDGVPIFVSPSWTIRSRSGFLIVVEYILVVTFQFSSSLLVPSKLVRGPICA